MKLQIRFQGNYENEFGKHPKGYSRKWKAYHILNQGVIIPGEVYQEPDYNDGGTYYKFWLYAEYKGIFKTRKELYKCIKKETA